MDRFGPRKRSSVAKVQEVVTDSTEVSERSSEMTSGEGVLSQLFAVDRGTPFSSASCMSPVE